MDDQLASSKKTLKSANQLLFSYGIGSTYFALLVPAMALYFSQNPNSYKIIFTYYFLAMTILQLIPGLIVRHVGLKMSMIGYAIIFLIGTGIGYYYQGDKILLISSRVCQGIGLSVIPFFTKVIAGELPKKLIKTSFIQRTIIINLSGPFIIILFGGLIHFYSWRVCYLTLGYITIAALIWLCFFFKDIKIQGLFPIKKQTQMSWQFIKQAIYTEKRSVAVFISLNLFMGCSAFLFVSYAFIFHDEFHLPILFVSTIPLFYSLAEIVATVFPRLQKKLQASDQQFVVISVIILNIITFVTFLLASMSIGSWVILLVGFSITTMINCLLYIYINTYFGLLLKNTNNNIEFNIIYYLSKNLFPMVIVFIWSFFENDHSSVSGIIFITTAISSIILLSILNKIYKVQP